jgi:hypothetical protein
MNTMSLLRNSVIVGGATFLVGSAFMEIGKADSKSDIGKWPYIATFLSGALGFYLLKQNFIPVPKALELNADIDYSGAKGYVRALDGKFDGANDEGYFPVDEEDFSEMVVDEIGEHTTLDAEMDGEKLMVSSFDFDDGSMMVGIGTEDIDVDDPDFMEMMIGKDGKIEQFSLPIGKDDYQRHYQVKPSHYGKMKTQNQTNERAGGDFVRTDGDGKYAHPMIPQGQFMAESLREEYERHWGEIDDDQAKGLIRCRGCDEPASYYDEMNFCEACQGRKKEGLMDDEGNFTDDPSHPLYEYPKPKYAESLQSFAAEVFMADRKIRRRTRWTWTRGPEEGYGDKDKVPYADIYGQQVRQGRGYYGSYVPSYKIEDAYHISDLPEGYHLHLLKPTLRKSNWVAVAKSPNDNEWKSYTSSNKAGLTKQLLNWYNKDIATPEVKALSPIDKLKIKKGIKSGKVSIDRVSIPEVIDKKGNILTQEEVQFYASGGPDALTPIHFASHFPNASSINNMKIFSEYTTLNKYDVFTFAQGLAFIGDKVTTLRSVNRFNKNREQWVKSYPAWFQNAVKNKISYLSMSITPIEQHDAKFTINTVNVVKFLNGVKRYRWSEVEPREMIKVYGEDLPQFQVLMPNGNLETPRPSSQRKIYESAMNQNDEGTWEVNEFELMLALVDKYKFENSIFLINERMTNLREPNIWRANNQTKNLISALELMCRRFKKNLN